MRESICTIPVSEIFEVQEGCPLCRMHDTVEEHIIKYILGDAMMEPDVRIETNKIGFCPDHFEKMLKSPGRLQLALMLESHMKEISANVLKGSAERQAKNAKEINDGCFICNKINWGFERMLQTVYRCYENEEDFRKLFNSQPHFCLKHYEMLLSGNPKKKCKKHGKEMTENLNRINGDYVKSLTEKATQYCTMYDYHNAGNADFGDSRFAVEDIVKFLTMGQK